MNSALNILVVEDDAALREALCFTLELSNFAVTGVAGGEAALAELERAAFNLVITDLRMQPMDGLQVLQAIRARQPQLPVLLMTAYGDVDKAVAAMRGGACDFLMKPFEPEALLGLVNRYALAARGRDELVAADPRTRSLLAVAARVAETDATVLLCGESGTGKEVFARYLHEHSARARGPFVAINCAAIPENLLEATLFGYEKGAFTGAQAGQAGKFEQAQNGTLLLDEISEMPLLLQAKLLRVLQEREVERVGGKKPVALDIRVLATSNRDMQKEVAGGRFREDLYYRLAVFPLSIPPLRERPGDIVPLARDILLRNGERSRRQLRCSPAAEQLLLQYRWPGNVRELENVLQRASILAGCDEVSAEILRLCLPQLAETTPLAADPAIIAGAVSGTADIPGLPVLPVAVPEAVVAASATEARPGSMRDLERDHILATLREVGGSRKKAIERLGISERSLRYKLQRYRSEGFEV